MSFDTRRLRTVAELKALAHPLRISIIEQLSLYGPMTATELGERLDESPANCSWHLRTLAKSGFVEETGEGKGRRRPWRMTSIGFRFDTANDDGPEVDGFNLAVAEVRSLLLRREVDRFERNIRGGETWGLGLSQGATYLTRDEAISLQARLLEVIGEHRERLTGEEEVPEGARLVHVLSLLSVSPEEGS